MGQFGHLNKLQEEYGPKGFKVIAITGEDKAKVMKFMAQKAPSIPQYQLGMGGGIPRTDGGNGIPHCWLVGADGKVVYEGHPGSLNKKLIEGELKKVERPSPDALEARASKMVVHADGLVAENRYFQAREILETVAKELKATKAADAASEKLAAFKKDEKIKAEIKAQETLNKYIGGLELPKEKLSGKDRDKLTVILESLIKRYGEDTPGAKAIAEEWLGLIKEA